MSAVRAGGDRGCRGSAGTFRDNRAVGARGRCGGEGPVWGRGRGVGGSSSGLTAGPGRRQERVQAGQGDTWRGGGHAVGSSRV